MASASGSSSAVDLPSGASRVHPFDPSAGWIGPCGTGLPPNPPPLRLEATACGHIGCGNLARLERQLKLLDRLRRGAKAMAAVSGPGGAAARSASPATSPRRAEKPAFSGVRFVVAGDPRPATRGCSSGQGSSGPTLDQLGQRLGIVGSVDPQPVPPAMSISIVPAAGTGSAAVPLSSCMCRSTISTAKKQAASGSAGSFAHSAGHAAT